MTGTTRTAARLAAAGTALAAVLAGGPALAAVPGGVPVAALTGGATRAETRTGAGAGAGADTGAGAGAEAGAGAGFAGAGTVTGIPRNFLLHEPRARRPVDSPGEEEWTIRNGTRETFRINPCGLRRPSDTGRTAGRTVAFHAPLQSSYEQLVIYRSAGDARRAVAGLLAQVDRCARVTSGGRVVRSRATIVRAGDLAAKISVQNHGRGGVRPGVGGQRAVVVRQGRAVALYTLGGDYGRVNDSEFTRQLKEARRMASKVCSLGGVC